MCCCSESGKRWELRFLFVGGVDGKCMGEGVAGV